MTSNLISGLQGAGDDRVGASGAGPGPNAVRPYDALHGDVELPSPGAINLEPVFEAAGYQQPWGRRNARVGRYEYRTREL
ncbi:MAG: hypothetical protein ABSF45_05165 [Terriglobia bacterium]